MSDITQILSRIEARDPQASTQLRSVIEAELRNLVAQTPAVAQNEQTLHGAELVHEAYRQLVGFSNGDDWPHRGHFFSEAAEAVRGILLEQVRRRESGERDGNPREECLGILGTEIALPLEDMVEFDHALERLEDSDPQAAAIVKLRVFAGLTIEDAAEALGIPARTAHRDWSFAEAWLFRSLHGNT
ncbi:MAG TPA: ECF-type sigma factor [Planctomycetaceae bacterium]|nr:ECF-type sigma factor [Planctomycetaceae bacterium]